MKLHVATSSMAVILSVAAASRGATNTTQLSVLDPITVTARGVETPLSKTPGGVGVIGPQELAARPVASVPDLFTLIPGVAKSSDSAWSSEVSIRGLSRDSVVLLIDGCRVNTANDINARYGLVAPMEIERVEVLKGPISSLYGSGSLGGVVNVVTRGGRFTEALEEHGGLSLYVLDNPEGFGAFVFGNLNAPDWYAYASQGYRDFDSFEDGRGIEMRNSQYEDRQTAVKGGYRLNGRHRVEGQFQYYEGRDVGIPGSGTAPLPATADVTYPRVSRELASGVYTYTPSDSVLQQSQLTFFYQAIDRRVRIDEFPAASPVLEIRPQADHRTTGGKWQNVLATERHTIVAGLDVWQRRLDSTRATELRSGIVQTDIPLPTSSFLSSGVFAEDSSDLGERLMLSAGARTDFIRVENDPTPKWDARKSDESSWNAHLGSVVALTENLSTKVLVARAYRAASLEERYQYIVLGGGVTKLGNPDLDAEESWFGEWGLNWLGERLSAGVSAFVNDLNNLIAEERVSPVLFETRNVREARIHGAEAEVRLHATDWLRLYGNIAYAKGRDENTGDDLPGIAPLSGLMGVRGEAPHGFWGSAEVTVTAAQNDTPEGVGTAGSWSTTDLRLGYASAGRLSHKVYVGVNNVFDRTYHDYLTTSRGFEFNAPARAFLCGYETTF